MDRRGFISGSAAATVTLKPSFAQDATYPTHAASIDELIKRADEALYWIKSHGRNRIRLYSAEIPAKT